MLFTFWQRFTLLVLLVSSLATCLPSGGDDEPKKSRNVETNIYFQIFRGGRAGGNVGGSGFPGAKGEDVDRARGVNRNVDRGRDRAPEPASEPAPAPGNDDVPARRPPRPRPRNEVGSVTDTDLTSPDAVEEVRRSRAYQRMLMNKVNTRNRLCPVCMASIPIYDVTFTVEQEERVRRAMREFGIGKYDFNAIRKDLSNVGGHALSRQKSNMIEQDQEICSDIVKGMLLKRSRQHMQQAKADLRNSARTVVENAQAARRLIAQRHIIDNIELDREDLGCNDGHEHKAKELGSLFNNILGPSY